MKKNKSFSFVSAMLCVLMIFYSSSFVGVPKANAYEVMDVGAILGIVYGAAIDLRDYLLKVAETAWKEKEKVLETLSAHAVVLAKIAALLAVQEATALLIGNEDMMIRDWDAYLFTSARQTALNQMNTFYNTVSKGRLSSLNYEGVGPNYDAYLKSLSEKNLQGTKLETDIVEYVSDPYQNLFSDGTMRGLMAYMECGNNPLCYMAGMQQKYESFFTQTQKRLEMEQQNGLLPMKIDGRIFRPATLISNALMEVDKFGTNLIMTADSKPGVSAGAATQQIFQGMFWSIASRSINYGIVDKGGKSAIASQSSQYPFSLSYTSKPSGNTKTNAVENTSPSNAPAD